MVVQYSLLCTLDSAGPLSPRAASALKQEIEKERAELMAKKDMAESEKNKAADELSKRESELKSAQDQHEELNKKLKDLESKVDVEIFCTHTCTITLYICSVQMDLSIVYPHSTV